MSLKKSILDRDKIFTKVTKSILKVLKPKLDELALEMLDNPSKVDWSHIVLNDDGICTVQGRISLKLGDKFYDNTLAEYVIVTKDNLLLYSYYVNVDVPVKDLENSSVQDIVKIIKQGNNNAQNSLLQIPVPQTKH